MAAVPSIGRASGVEGGPPPEADLTRALYEQYANQILRYCLHQLGSREEAEDAVQSTFLNAFRGIKRGIVPELESAWLFKIAHNVCLSRRRSTWRRGRIEAPTDFEVVEELAPAPSRRADELIGLQDVLEQMPEQQRRAILLREWQGLSYREIADELELSQAAVETLIFRARRSLAQGLEQPVQLMERKRARRAAGALGNLLSTAQGWLLGGGAAVKVAATVAVVSAGTVVATAPVHERAPLQTTKQPAPAGAARHPQAPAHENGTGSVAVVPPVSAGGVQHVVAPVRAKHTVHLPAAPAPPPVSSTPAPTLAAEPAPSAPAPAAPAEPAEPAAGPAPAPAAPAPAAPVVATPQAPATPARGNEKAKDAKPVTPPGQAKKNDDRPAPAVPPGQAKKKDLPAAPAVPATPAVTPPAPSIPPGQAKKSEGAPAQTPVATTTATPAPPSEPPGQAKKADPPSLPVDAPMLGSVAVPGPAAAPAAFVPAPQGSADNGNGKAKGKDK